MRSGSEITLSIWPLTTGYWPLLLILRPGSADGFVVGDVDAVFEHLVIFLLAGPGLPERDVDGLLDLGERLAVFGHVAGLLLELDEVPRLIRDQLLGLAGGAVAGGDDVGAQRAGLVEAAQPGLEV